MAATATAAALSALKPAAAPRPTAIVVDRVTKSFAKRRTFRESIAAPFQRGGALKRSPCFARNRRRMAS